MSLAPHHVPWALSACALLLLSLSLLWMVFHDATARAMARLNVGDGIAGWLTFTAAYHTVDRQAALPQAIIASSTALWLLWGGCAVYLGARLLPIAMRKDTVFIAVALAGWAWSIGAGYQFLGELEARAEALRLRPAAVLAEDSPQLAPLQGALALKRLAEETKQEVAGLLGDLASGKIVSPARRAAVRQVLFPEILEHYQRELRRLKTYQVLQIVLLGAILLAWGFGRKQSD